MDLRGREAGDEEAVAGTPEDVAALYLWANLQGAKYRDFSASRREHRAQVRYRAAKAMQERELREQASADAAAAAAEQEELDAMAAAQLHDGEAKRGLRMQSLAIAEEAAGRVTGERLKAIRRGEAAAHAAAIVLRETREIASAQASARQQALRYAATEERRRHLAGPQPRGPMSGTNTAVRDETVAQSEFGALPIAAIDRWTIERALMREFPYGMQHGKEGKNAVLVGAEAEPSEGEAGLTGPAWLCASQTQPLTERSAAIDQLAMGERAGGRLRRQGERRYRIHESGLRRDGLR